MDVRLHAIKESQGNISLSDTSSVTVVGDAAALDSDVEHEKTSIEIDDKNITLQNECVDLQDDESLRQQRAQPLDQSQFQQRYWWWHNSITPTGRQVIVSSDDPTPRKTGYYRQFRQILQHMRQLNRRQIIEYAVRWRWVLLFFGLSLITGIVMWVWRKDLLRSLEFLSIAVRGMGTSGQLLVFFLIFASAFPPMIGYGTFQSLSGFTFGFNLGFPLSYFSALFGAIACFMISRRWLKLQVKNIMTKYPNLEAVVKAVDKKGFKLFVLIRLSPYPYNLLNVLFASTDIPLSYFALGTAISLIKIALHVYIGAHLTSFAKHVLGDGNDMTDSERRADTIREVTLVIGSILATGVMVYVYFVAKRAVEEVRQESEEARAFLGMNDITTNDGDDGGHQVSDVNRIEMEQASVAEDWIEWNESDEEKTIDGRNASSDDLMIYNVA